MRQAMRRSACIAILCHLVGGLLMAGCVGTENNDSAQTPGTGGQNTVGGTNAASSSSGGGTGTETGGAGNTGGASVVSTCALPTAFSWQSTGPVIVPVSDATHDLVAVKDPTVVRYGDRYHVYASSVSSGGVYGMVYTSFTDFSSASTAPFYYMDQTAGFNTYVAAPQVFYFTPQKKWYLVFQSGPPRFATSDDLSDPTKWTAPAPFFATTPAIVTKNGGWVDFWVICDADYCHLFFSNDDGRWYKSKTTIANFPSGFDEPIVVMEDPDAGRLFEACNVYKVAGSNQYLALIEAYDGTSNWRRYFRSFTAESLEGPWTPLQDRGTTPFAGKSNVTFDDTAWTADISHGEMVRAGYDETMTIDPCHLQYLYQGFEPATDTSAYNSIPWKLGLLTLK